MEKSGSERKALRKVEELQMEFHTWSVLASC